VVGHWGDKKEGDMEGVAWQEIRKLNIRTFKVSVVLWLFFQPQYIMAKSTDRPCQF
jgi:hypothetical protein